MLREAPSIPMVCPEMERAPSEHRKYVSSPMSTVDQAGGDRVHADAVLPELHRERFDEREKTALGHGVRRTVRVTVPSCQR